MNEIINVWKTVFKKPGYAILTIIIALIFYILNVIIQNYQTLSSFLKNYGLLSGIIYLFNGSIDFHKSTLLHSYISLVLSSLLIGILISLITFKIKNAKHKSKKTGVLSSVGIFIALLAPGCAACGIGLIAVLGIGGIFISLLPFKGLEISVLAIIIIGFAIFKISKDLTICEVCTIQQMKGGKNNERRTK
ncbi:hypothetical protein COU62_02390 [Candidatus Pacearchaeota archaeon CG10_big_fil_rev_8_21_14_0_10_35_219]|nr:hypothetical protein [Candidatus Pacearchaeota archaeon]OIO41988.1 MAG: hypothetical protein AUJ63_04530 [Candidatus Pacearchaeota archaeon CG1_02_35_32]PIO07816.1 MAG: hypothetical protein COU62_02390 [Candidatus Pacearchaeota archaeon CG10_big_fil_rev_8_21_14_0_10_35_219]PIY81038.1 MAG: hypothetical protein COY79_04500 [Candidatus Pacearchaeota archaeon CG_4_10_14_0_8_um_filter_35_169]PIZ79907.1 MAG: hypothetical protein COY00_02805 [Candidatus Pacearchaeota archaeon CG_4_10_14_0_2_um_filt